MTKNDLAHHVFAMTELNFRQSVHAVESILGIMKKELQSGGKVTLRRFGEWSVRHKGERVGLNPRTLEKHVVTARNVVRFKPGLAFKEAVNNGLGRDILRNG